MFDIIYLNGKIFKLDRSSGDTWLLTNNKWISIK